MKHKLILIRNIGSKGTSLIVNHVVVAEKAAENCPQVVETAHQLSVALGVPLVECNVEMPDVMDGVPAG